MIKYELLNHTAVVSLNHPEKRNALNPEMIEKLKFQLKDIDENSFVKSVIITGGSEVFCAGADLDYLNKLSLNSSIDNYNDSRSLAELYLSIYELSKPTIAAVNGPAIAGGCGLASVCDFIIAHPEKSKFGYSEVKIGFIPAIVSIFLIKKVGEGLARQLLLESELINGNRAYEIGLVSYLSENVIDDSLKLSEKLNKNYSESIKLTKKMLNQISGLSVREAVNQCINLNVISRSTPDFKDGLNKFLKKDK